MVAPAVCKKRTPVKYFAARLTRPYSRQKQGCIGKKGGANRE